MSFDALLQLVDKTVRSTLGRPVLYTSGTSAAVLVTGVFDARYVRPATSVGEVASSSPAVFLRLSELTSDPYVDGGARVVIGGVTYAAYEVERDGLGGVVMHLHEA